MNFHAAQTLAGELERDVPGTRILMIANGVGLLRDRGVKDIPAWAANCPQACWLVYAQPPGYKPYWSWYANHCDDLLMELIADAFDGQLESESVWLDERILQYRNYKGGDAS